AATTPTFIAHAPVADAERICGAIGCTLFGKIAARWIIAVLDPIAQFAGRTTAHISGQVRLGTNHSTEVDEFVSTETAVLYASAPMNIHALRTFCLRADAIAPVVVIRKATA